MNRKVIAEWAKRLREFDERNPSFLHLRFPLRIETTQGEAFSPTGILCQIHAEKTKTQWNVRRSGNRKLANFDYLGDCMMPPDSVRLWLGVDESFWSNVYKRNDYIDGFKNVALFLDELLSVTEGSL